MKFLLCFIFCFSFVGLQAQWTEFPSQPGIGRNHPVSFTLNEKGFVFTGFNTSSSIFFDDGNVFDPSTNSWSNVNNFPGGPRGFAVGASHDGIGYLGFGRDDNTYFNDLWAYNANSHSWTGLSSCPCQGRRHPAFIITENGKILAGLGDGFDANGNYVSGFTDWWSYDIQSDAWSQEADLPGPGRHHPYYFAIGNDAYVGFGHGPSGIFKDFYKFDTGTGEWTVLQDFPGEARVAGTHFSKDGFGYILDGEGIDHQNLNNGEFYRYDPSDDSWTALQHRNGDGLWAPGSFVINDMVYVIGGDLDDNTSLNKLWAFNLDENRVNDKMNEASGTVSISNDFYDQQATFRWLDCNNNYAPIFDETSDTYDIPQGGNVALEVSYSYGGIDTSNCFNNGSLGLTVFDLDKSHWEVYPNPAKETLTLSFDEVNSETLCLEIVSFSGQILQTIQVQTQVQNIDVSELTPGIYFIRLLTEDGQNMEIRKFQKK